MTDKQHDQQGSFIDTNEWVPIHTLPGFEACIEYYVNRQGQIKSTKGNLERLLKLSPHNTGYLQVSLTQRIGRKKPIKVLVHKIVAFAFLGPPPTPYGQDVNCSMVDHIDEDKTNNHVDNLRWVNRSDNNNKRAYNRFHGKVRTDLKTSEERLEAKREYNREFMKKSRQDPVKRNRDRERMRQLRADPKYAAKEKLRQREYDAKRRANIKADEEKAAKQREYKREWMRKKRAKQKAAKIDKDGPETSTNG